jgi:NAD(P)-dependent dehydrogenase (short-subunit alcohol dehydrogenase family)
MNQDLRFQDKVALVTGGGSGIGRATAVLMAAEGAAMVVADVDEQAAQVVAREISDAGGRAIAIRCDVSDAAQAEAAVQRVVSEFGRLDVLFNNAGITRRATVVDLSEGDWDRVMAVNVKGIYLMSRSAIPVLAASGGGAIVNTASGWGLVGGAKAAVYCASKGAVVLLTKAMAIDHAQQKIRVNCVCPGDTGTQMLQTEASQLGEQTEPFMAEAADRPLGRIGSPDEIARAVLFLASDDSSFVTGTALVVDGGGLAG